VVIIYLETNHPAAFVFRKKKRILEPRKKNWSDQTKIRSDKVKKEVNGGIDLLDGCLMGEMSKYKGK